MAITTYTELQTAVANWLGGRTDLTSRIPEFIALAEAKFNRELRNPQMEKRSYTTIAIATAEPEFVSLPSDFQTMRSVRLSGVTGKPRLQFLTQSQADELRYSIADSTGQPEYFTIIGDEIEFLPTPNDEYEIEMIYRANIPALSSNSTNWLLDIAPDAYLYGALLEAAVFIKDDERVQLWIGGLTQAIDGLNRLGSEQSYNAGPLVMSVPGYNP